MSNPVRRSRILVVDDHPVVRDGLIAAINSQPDMQVCGEADSTNLVFERVERERPDAVLMDLFLGRQDGVTLIKNLLGPWPDLPILVISMQEDHLYAPRCWQAGARGYVSKLEPVTEILGGLRNILAGKLHFQAEIFAKSREGAGTFDRLTDREMHVLQLIGQGLKANEIATQMSISPRTVDTHRENIKRKLGVASTAQLLRLAIEKNSRQG